MSTARSTASFPSRSRRTTGAMAAAALTLGLLGAGCGSSSTTTTTGQKAAAVAPAPVLSKTAFVAAANAICAKSDPLLSEATAKLSAVRSKTELDAIVKGTYVPAIEVQLREMAKLQVPPAARAAVTGMLALVQSDLAKLQRDPALVNTDIFGDFARVAHPYGLTSCAPLS